METAQSALSPEELQRALREVPSSALVSGLLVYLPRRSFSEQQLFKFFYDLQGENPQLADEFDVVRHAEGFQSKPLRRILDFLEIGKMVEVGLPNPVDQHYKIRDAHREYRRRTLEGWGILPVHKDALAALATMLSDVEPFGNTN